MFVKCLVAGVGNIHTYVCGVQASLTTQLESGDWRKEPWPGAQTRGLRSNAEFQPRKPLMWLQFFVIYRCFLWAECVRQHSNIIRHNIRCHTMSEGLHSSFFTLYYTGFNTEVSDDQIVGLFVVNTFYVNSLSGVAQQPACSNSNWQCSTTLQKTFVYCEIAALLYLCVWHMTSMCT